MKKIKDGRYGFEVGDVIRETGGTHSDYREKIIKFEENLYHYIYWYSDHPPKRTTTGSLNYLSRVELDPDFALKKQFNKDLQDLVEGGKLGS